MNPLEDDKPVDSQGTASPRPDEASEAQSFDLSEPAAPDANGADRADEATADFRERAASLPGFLDWDPDRPGDPARPAWPAVPSIKAPGLDGADPASAPGSLALPTPPPLAEEPLPDAAPSADDPTAAEPFADAPEPRGTLSALRDNVEAIAFALILALLLRHCAIEVFKIPTGSMEPTLMGEDGGKNVGDRILVDKSAYLFGDPARWDIVVFHYPLDWSRNFIKRCLVLPNEWFRIERGDVWVGRGDAQPDGSPPPMHPARKPRLVREQLYVPCYPPTGRDARTMGSPSDWWHRVDGGAGSWQVESHGRLVYSGDPADSSPAATGMTSREYGFPIRDTDEADVSPTSGGGDPFAVADVRVRCRVTLGAAESAGEFEVSWSPGDGREHTLRIASEGREPSAAATKKRSKPLAARLVPGKAVDVELESVDGDLRAWVDGDEVAVLSDEVTIEEAGHAEGPGDPGSRQALRLSARGGRLVVDSLRIDHDLYYTNYRSIGVGETWPKGGQTPRAGPDEFFMLGDNTRHSSDSRRWQATGIRLKDGTKIEWDPSPSAPSPPNPRYPTVGGVPMKEVTDVEGVTRRWAVADEEESSYDTRRIPFVKRERIVGRAWFALVFWPVDQVLSRIRFVH